MLNRRTARNRILIKSVDRLLVKKVEPGIAYKLLLAFVGLLAAIWFVTWCYYSVDAIKIFE